jgi:hypothetical protein
VKLGDDQVIDSFFSTYVFFLIKWIGKRLNGCLWIFPTTVTVATLLRVVFVVHQRDQDLKTILKISRWSRKMDFDNFFDGLRDALVMDHLTGSPQIVNICAHCGAALWVEAIPFEVQEFIIPGEGYIGPEELDRNFKPHNTYTRPEEKLDMAIVMTGLLADLHGFEGGVM